MTMTVFWVVEPCSLVEIYRPFTGTCCLHHQGFMMMEATSSSEPSDNFNQTTRLNNPEDSYLHTGRTGRRENLKSHNADNIGVSEKNFQYR
jgi:hypothetical protein